MRPPMWFRILWLLKRRAWLFVWLPFLFGALLAIQSQVGIWVVGWILSVATQFVIGIAFFAKIGPFKPAKPGAIAFSRTFRRLASG